MDKICERREENLIEIKNGNKSVFVGLIAFEFYLKEFRNIRLHSEIPFGVELNVLHE